MADNILRHPRFDPGQLWTTFYPSQLFERPGPPEWIIDGLLLRRTVQIFAGAKAVGKSLLSQQLLSAVALGRECAGHHIEQANAFGYFCEDSHEWLARRQFDINAAFDVDPPDYESRLGWISRAGKECKLATFEFGKMTLTGEWHHLWREVQENSAQLVVIDTASAVFGGNENSRQQVEPFIRALAEKAIEIDGAIILNLNTSRADPLSFAGSGQWHNSCRGGFNMHRPVEEFADPRERILLPLDANYTGRTHATRLRYHEGVFEPDDTEQLMPRVRTPLSRAILDDEMFKGLERHRDNGRKVPADYDKPGSLPRSYRKTFGPGWAWNDLYAAQDRLVSDGKVLKVKVRSECLLRPAAGRQAFPYQDEEPWP